MVVLSVGMRKSGSGWLFNLTNDLLISSGYDDIRRIKEMPLLRPILKKGANVSLGRPTPVRLARLVVAHTRGYTFAVKSHAAPTPGLRLCTALGVVRPTYIYRDPRDVVLSALDHARVRRESGARIDLASLYTLEDSLQMVQRELTRWERWMRFPSVHVVRYEDLVADTPGEVRRLAGYLGLDLPAETLDAVVRRYDKATYAAAQDQGIDRKLHLNKGIPGRFEDEMDAEQRALCERRLGPYLERMGYA